MSAIWEGFDDRSEKLMAKRKDPIWATSFASGKPESINTNPLKPNDCEPWVASDSKKALSLLSRKFPDKNPDDTRAMVEMLAAEIGQDWDNIVFAVETYLNAKL